MASALEASYTEATNVEKEPLLAAARGRRSYAIPRDTQDHYVLIQNGASVPSDTNHVASALRVCDKHIVKPFQILFQIVAFKPLYPSSRAYGRPCRQFLNILYLLLVLIIMVFGYVMTWIMCLYDSHDDYVTRCSMNATDVIPNVTVPRQHVLVPPKQSCHVLMSVQDGLVSILHFVCYAFSWYSMRRAEPEQLVSLQERTFLFEQQREINTEARQKILKSSRILRYAVTWLFVYCVADGVGLSRRFNFLDISHLCQSGFSYIIMYQCVGMSYTLLNLVYVTVVVNYVVQCRFLALYIKSLINRIQEETIELGEAMKKCNEIAKEIAKVNRHAGISVSFVLVNLVAIIIAEMYWGNTPQFASKDFGTHGSIAAWWWSMYIRLALIMILAVVIFIEASALTRRCSRLQMTGMDVFVKFTPHDPTSINSECASLEKNTKRFHYFMTSLKLSAKLFMVPIRGGHVCLISVIVAFALLIHQLDIIYFIRK